MRILYCCGALLISAAIIGCGGGPTLYPVKGKVSIGGKPLTAGSLTFWPKEGVESGKAAPAEGVIKKDGTYKLVTKGNDGAPLGEYTVTIDPTGGGTEEPADPNPDPAAQPKKKAPAVVINPRYLDKSTSPLKLKVVAEPAAGAYDINLTP